MKDRLLNGLLVLQVLLSLLLTGAVVNTSDDALLHAEQPRVHPANSSTLQPDPDLFLPRLIWLHPGEDQYVGLSPFDQPYEPAWRELRGVLGRSMRRADEFRRANRSDLTEALGQPMIGVDLPIELHPDVWARVLGYPAAAEGDVAGIDRAVFVLGQLGQIFFLGNRVPMRVLELGEWERQSLLRLVQSIDPAAFAAYRPLVGPEQAALVLNPFAPAYGRAIGVGALDNRVQEVGPLVDPWVMVPADPVRVATQPTRAAAPRPGDLIPKVFPDVTVVREVREQDGAVTYTDGQRALRLYPHGAVQYWEFSEGPAGEGKPPGDLDTALRVAAAFIGHVHFWPEHVTLAGYSQTDDTFVLTYQVRPWLPLESRQAMLEVKVAHGRVTYLYRGPDLIPDTVAAQEPLADASDVLAYVAEMENNPRIRVRAMWPAQRVPMGQFDVLIPVWVVELSNGNRLVVDGRTGRFLW